MALIQPAIYVSALYNAVTITLEKTQRAIVKVLMDLLGNDITNRLLEELSSIPPPQMLNLLDYDLVIYSPVDCLLEMLKKSPKNDKELEQIALGVLEDSTYTECCIIFPPFIIAAACLIIANQGEESVHKWLESFEADRKALHRCVNVILALYRTKKDFKEDAEAIIAEWS